MKVLTRGLGMLLLDPSLTPSKSDRAGRAI